jgi:hypothetical protein
MDWIDVAKDGDRWQAVVNAVGFHKMRRIFWLVDNLLASHEWLFFMELLKSTYTSLQQSIEHRIIQNRMFRVKQVLRRKHEIVAYKDSMHKIGSSLIGDQLVRYNCNTVSVNRW